MDKSSHTIEKLIKAAEKLEFEDERHIEIIMELVWKVDKDRSLIKDKDGLINQLETKVKDLEEEKHLIRARCFKAMQDINCMKVDMTGISFQSLDGRESCSRRNAEPCFRKKDMIYQGNPCIERIEATKVNICY